MIYFFKKKELFFIAKEYIWELIEQEGQKIEKEMDSLSRKRTGSYFTRLKFTDFLMESLVSYYIKNKPNKPIYNATFLEPCVGSGNFVFSYIKAIEKRGLTKEEASILFSNIYVCDVNEKSLITYKKLLSLLASEYWNITLTEKYFETHIKDGILIDVNKNYFEYKSIETVFPSFTNNKFDIIATNPPYKNLKAETTHYQDIAEYEKDKTKYKNITAFAKKQFPDSTTGTINMYQIFVEEILKHYSNKNSLITLLIPYSITTDKSCKKLRTHILQNHKIVNITSIPEGSDIIDAKQALVAFLIEKGKETTNVNIIDNFNFKINKSNIVNVDNFVAKKDNAIFITTETNYRMLQNLKHFPTIAELKFIKNLRGELDVTFAKKFITEKKTSYPLIKGRNIAYYNLKEPASYVTDDFVDFTKKSLYIKQKRIACQQIANMKKDRRLTFSLIPENQILDNTCNFISVELNDYNINIYTLLGLLNTKFMNIFFKLLSSNNHVNNYEIDTFPIPIYAEELKEITRLTEKYLETKDASILQQIEKLTLQAYAIK